MNTQQELTTEQVEVLALIKALEIYKDDYHMDSSLEEKLADFAWDSIEMTEEDGLEHIKILKYYKYLNADSTITVEGKQYLYLATEYVNLKKQQPTVVINNSFTLLNIEKLGVNLDIISSLNDVIENVKEGYKVGKKIIRAVKNMKA